MTIKLSGAEIIERINEPSERIPFAECRGKQIVASEVTTLRIKTRKEVILESIQLAMRCAREHNVLYLNRFCYSPQIVDAVRELPEDERSERFTQWSYGLQEICDDHNDIVQYIQDNDVRVVVINSFEHAATTPRHQRRLVDQIRYIAFALGCAVVVVTQDMRKQMSDGSFSSGALGLLASLSTNVIDCSKDDSPVTSYYPKKKEDPNAIVWVARIDMITAKKCLGKHVWESNQRDLPLVLWSMKHREKELLEGRVRVKGVHDKLPPDEAEAAYEVLFADKLMEIQELQKRVQELYRQGAFTGIEMCEKYLQDLRDDWGVEFAEVVSVQ